MEDAMEYAIPDRRRCDRHRCQHPGCGRAFAVVYSRASLEEPAWLALACPHCGTAHALMLTALLQQGAEGAYVLPLESVEAGLTV